jgi:hypothetical protein
VAAPAGEEPQEPGGFERKPPQASACRRSTSGQGTPGRQVRVAVQFSSGDDAELGQAVAVFLPPGKRLWLSVTDNRYSMITVRRQPDGYFVRAHRMFVGAVPRVLRALARYVVHNDPRASRLLGEFIRLNEHVIKTQPRRPRKMRLRTAGRVHDLQKIFDGLNASTFGGTLQARITWGPALRRSGPRRSIKMGSFSLEDRIIRIHPALDQEGVPDYFVAWIVFHEMLHGKHGAVASKGRRCYHTKAFFADERSFSDYDRACLWERANIHKLLR